MVHVACDLHPYMHAHNAHNQRHTGPPCAAQPAAVTLQRLQHACGGPNYRCVYITLLFVTGSACRRAGMLSLCTYVCGQQRFACDQHTYMHQPNMRNPRHTGRPVQHSQLLTPCRGCNAGVAGRSTYVPASLCMLLKLTAPETIVEGLHTGIYYICFVEPLLAKPHCTAYPRSVLVARRMPALTYVCVPASMLLLRLPCCST
jgi:hypothetical protein